MRVSRTTGAMSGLVIVVLGIWGGLIPFIGPYFNYSFGPNTAWRNYTVHRLWLDILPGGAVVVGGLMIINARSRIGGTLGSWLALAGGAWFAVGPPVSRLWDSAATATRPIGAPYGAVNRQILELVGYYYGLGVLIVGFAAFSLGRFVSRPAMVSEEAELRSLAEVRAAEEREPRQRVAEQPPADQQPVADRHEGDERESEQPETQQSETQQAETEQLETEQPTAGREPEPIHGPRD